MAANFRISMHRNSDSLDLKLMGDFDGTSACELLNALKENCDGVARVFVNTSGLKDVYPFGVDTFQSSLYLLKDRRFRLLFAGKNATSIAPERNKFF
jgi:hypothetical protein